MATSEQIADEQLRLDTQIRVTQIMDAHIATSNRIAIAATLAVCNALDRCQTVEELTAAIAAIRKSAEPTE